MAHRDRPGGPVFSVCGLLCGQTQTVSFQAQEKVQKTADFMWLLSEYEPLAPSLPTGKEKFL